MILVTIAVAFIVAIIVSVCFGLLIHDCDHYPSLSILLSFIAVVVVSSPLLLSPLSSTPPSPPTQKQSTITTTTLNKSPHLQHRACPPATSSHALFATTTNTFAGICHVGTAGRIWMWALSRRSGLSWKTRSSTWSRISKVGGRSEVVEMEENRRGKRGGGGSNEGKKLNAAPALEAEYQRLFGWI